MQASAHYLCASLSPADQDSRVRYYACEALYNIAKVAREGFMVFFHDVFDALFRLCADSEANVQNAAQFLDNLVKVRSKCYCRHVLEASCLLFFVGRGIVYS